MAKYIVTYYRCNKPSSPSESEYLFEEYQNWLNCMSNIANTTGKSHTVSANGTVSEGSKTTMPGYIIFEASSINRAIQIAKTCPFLISGGTVEVAELI